MNIADDHRYVTRFRNITYGPDTQIFLDPFDQAEAVLGVWDTVRKCFVKRSENGEWVPETSAVTAS